MNELTRLWGSAWLLHLIAFSLMLACVILCSLAVRSVVMCKSLDVMQLTRSWGSNPGCMLRAGIEAVGDFVMLRV